MIKTLRIFRAALSGRYYASRYVKQISHMHMSCTGKKEDVTEQIEALIAEREAQAVQREREKVAGLVKLLERTIQATAHVVRHDNLRRDIHAALATYNDNRKG
jgi:ATP-dependent exoDNAse (exonuclease V) alpha subunit